jgi:hypothetical protein
VLPYCCSLLQPPKQHSTGGQRKEAYTVGCWNVSKINKNIGPSSLLCCRTAFIILNSCAADRSLLGQEQQTNVSDLHFHPVRIHLLVSRADPAGQILSSYSSYHSVSFLLLCLFAAAPLACHHRTDPEERYRDSHKGLHATAAAAGTSSSHLV